MAYTESLSTVFCSICPRIINPDDVNECADCGEWICDSCPAFSCACVDDDAEYYALCMELRVAAIERAQLQVQRELMGQTA